MNKKAMSEQDIRTNYITPSLQQAGWKGARMREEVYFTDGRMIVRGQMAKRGKRKRADYILSRECCISRPGWVHPAGLGRNWERKCDRDVEL